MDAAQSCDRLPSILNDNDCPSFAVRPRSTAFAHYRSSQHEQAFAPLSGRHSRRTTRTVSRPRPLLLSLDSTSSKSSCSTMDSPSPRTPVYNDVPQLFTHYEAFARQDISAHHLSSPSSVIPLGDPVTVDAPPEEQMLNHKNSFQDGGISASHNTLPHYTFDNSRIASTSAPTNSNVTTEASSSSANPPAKKNKYHCPFATSHHCTATFTTSGHAARHGKKHTGEKGVHCPICNKAFTRKDNMKQHERIHKGPTWARSLDETRSQRQTGSTSTNVVKSNHVGTPDEAYPTPKTSLVQSPISNVASIDPSVIGTPDLGDEAIRYGEASLMGQIDGAPAPVPAYPSLTQEPAFESMAQLDRPVGQALHAADLPLQKPFSDLDTLALAAAFDPYSQGMER